MANLEMVRHLAISTPSKIVLLVADGLGGLPDPRTGNTELETARTPNLDRLAGMSMCGLTTPVAPGITPGSAPSHLALFGYDPIEYEIGRGILEALGVDFDIQERDVAARGNFCTIDANGIVTDRRAGRISTEKNIELCKLLSRKVSIPGIELFVVPVKEHRFVVVFRGDGLRGELTDSDPQKEGKSPRLVEALTPEASGTAALANEFMAKAKVALADSHPANMMLLRGFSKHPDLPQMSECFKLKAAAIAVYPMYRGLAKVVGMTALPSGNDLAGEIEALKRNYDSYDFFYVHFKKTDSSGEDGDFQAKAKAEEDLDAAIPQILALNPDVLMVAGDHSTPAMLKGHSWHPVPFLLYSKWVRRDKVTKFCESACAGGLLGTFSATDVMTLALANALKLEKYGA